MAIRTAVLINERDKRLGQASVPESAMVILHNGSYFVRSDERFRLTREGVSTGVIFRETEIYARESLRPI